MTHSLRERFAHTLPVWPVGLDGRCTCGMSECRRPGKHADERAPDGPDAPYAVVTGAESGILVFDPDVKGGEGHDGIEQLEELEDRLGQLDTFTVETPSGGMHLYVVHPGPRMNGKLTPDVDLKGDKASEEGLVYVVGPGSPGYVRTADPCVVTPAEPYKVFCGSEIAQLPDAWISHLLNLANARKKGFAPTPIDPSSEEGMRRIGMAVEACRTMPPSRADGQGGTRLFAICLRLVRGLELPIDVAHELVRGNFNPRCTYPDGVTPYPWSDEDIAHKLLDARDRSDLPCGDIAPKEVVEMFDRLATPSALRDLVPKAEEGAGAAPRKVPNPAHTYKYTIGQLSAHPHADKRAFNDLVTLFSRHPEWVGVWQYDEFAEQLLCVDPPIHLDAERTGLTPGDLGDLRSYLEHVGFLVSERDIASAITSASRMLRFHPVREYLSTLPIGTPEIFIGLAKHLFGTDDPMADQYLKMLMVASVRRIWNPGTQVDTVLVLHGGRQGEGKTTFVEQLFEPRWTRRGLPADLANRDASHALLGYRCVELGELASLLRTEKNAAKDFITWTDDAYRQYGNAERVRKPRQCVFVGTTNDDDFLSDATGNRRFWIVSIPKGHKIPTAWVTEHRDELWAAAVALAKDESFKHWIPFEEEAKVDRSAFIQIDAWQDVIRAYCIGKRHVKAVDVFTKAIFGEVKDFDRRKLLRITDTLKRLGCVTHVVSEQGRPAKYWLIPEDLDQEPTLSAQAMSSSESIKKALKN